MTNLLCCCCFVCFAFSLFVCLFLPQGHFSLNTIILQLLFKTQTHTHTHLIMSWKLNLKQINNLPEDQRNVFALKYFLRHSCSFLPFCHKSLIISRKYTLIFVTLGRSIIIICNIIIIKYLSSVLVIRIRLCHNLRKAEIFPLFPANLSISKGQKQWSCKHAHLFTSLLYFLHHVLLFAIIASLFVAR